MTVLTRVVTECIQNCDEVIQTRPVVRIAPEPFFKGVTSQGQADQLYCHTTNLIPQVDISGVQHYSLESTTNFSTHISDVQTYLAAGTGAALVCSRTTTALVDQFYPIEHQKEYTIQLYTDMMYAGCVCLYFRSFCKH